MQTARGKHPIARSKLQNTKGYTQQYTATCYCSTSFLTLDIQVSMLR